MTSRAVLWDLDGMLVDGEALHVEARAASLGGYGLELPSAFHEETLGISEEEVHAALVDRVGLPIRLNAWKDLKARHYEALSSRLACRETTRQAFLDLAEVGVPMAVVSNALRTEIDVALAATISRDDVSQGKLDPEGYLAATRRLGAAPSACLVVEDSEAGCQVGLAAGMTTTFQPHHAAEAPEGAICLPPEGFLLDLIEPWLNGEPLGRRVGDSASFFPPPTPAS